MRLFWFNADATSISQMQDFSTATGEIYTAKTVPSCTRLEIYPLTWIIKLPYDSLVFPNGHDFNQ
jgi:hypothetical protein